MAERAEFPSIVRACRRCRFPVKLSLVIFHLALVTLSMCHRARRSPRRLPPLLCRAATLRRLCASHVGSQVVTA